jgi:ADP-ribose pyrophosphatase YjhB (NUDIX family)
LLSTHPRLFDKILDIMLSTLCAGIVLIKKEKVLLVRHNAGTDYVNETYNLPTGRIIDGETEHETAARILFDETNLVVEPEHLVELPHRYPITIEHKNNDATLTSSYFFTDHYGGILEISDETIPEWIDLSKINQLPLALNVDKIIADAVEIKIQRAEKNKISSDRVKRLATKIIAVAVIALLSGSYYIYNYGLDWPRVNGTITRCYTETVTTPGYRKRQDDRTIFSNVRYREVTTAGTKRYIAHAVFSYRYQNIAYENSANTFRSKDRLEAERMNEPCSIGASEILQVNPSQPNMIMRLAKRQETLTYLAKSTARLLLILAGFVCTFFIARYIHRKLR